MPKVLIVDDEESIRNILREILEFEKFEVEEAIDGMDCLVKIKQKDIDIALLDIKMPKMDGMETLDRLQELAPEVPVIMISGHANIDTAVDAVKKGAYDFIEKPPDLNRLLITIRNALDRSTLVSETKMLKRRIAQESVQEIIGDSEAMQQIKQTIRQVGPTDARVLITGANGTGKELVARWLHAYSPRQDYPLVEVNCAAIPSELIESELFGHEKGSFTSAVKQRIGKFEQAHGGTLFLDEVGDMSLAAQAKVLRALQENRISRVGGDKQITVDVRVIAATNKDLRKEIQAGRFREDLYHRLAVIIIRIPDLNERVDDIPALVSHFNQVICAEYRLPPREFTDAAVKALQKVNWSGNVRELRNVVERLIILAGSSVDQADVEQYVWSAGTPDRANLKALFERFENSEDLKRFIEQAYREYQGTVS